jgi:hypothetical protein
VTTVDAHREAGGDQFVNWVSDFLPDDLPLSTRNNVRLFFYNYDSYWKRDAVHTRLSVLGSDLLEHINDGIRASPTVSIQDEVQVAIGRHS